jgi:SPP1 gp7 family putative phage head morphogenesis protein
MWKVTAETLAFLEALEWFKAKVVMKKSDWVQLEEMARRRAFTVANVAQASLVKEVWEALTRAIKGGTTLGQFRKDVETKLFSAWGESVDDPPWRVETIYRTNLQGAYNAGRYKQLTRPAIKRARPYWMFDAIMDNRVTHICEPLDRTILPNTDPWWTTHTPPLHFNCRSSIRALRAGAAQARGIRGEGPVVQPDKGFGRAPSDDEWRPDMSQFPEEMRGPVQEKLI